MPYILDAVILFIIIISVIRGVKKGFIKAAFSILSFLLAAALSFMFYVPFSEYITTTEIGQNVSQSLEESVYKAVSGEKENADTAIEQSTQASQQNSLGGTTEEIIAPLTVDSCTS